MMELIRIIMEKEPERDYSKVSENLCRKQMETIERLKEAGTLGENGRILSRPKDKEEG